MGRLQRERKQRVLNGEELSFNANRKAQRLIMALNDFAEEPLLGGWPQVIHILDLLAQAKYKGEGGC